MKPCGLDQREGKLFRAIDPLTPLTWPLLQSMSSCCAQSCWREGQGGVFTLTFWCLRGFSCYFCYFCYSQGCNADITGQDISLTVMSLQRTAMNNVESTMSGHASEVCEYQVSVNNWVCSCNILLPTMLLMARRQQQQQLEAVRGLTRFLWCWGVSRCQTWTGHHPCLPSVPVHERRCSLVPIFRRLNLMILVLKITYNLVLASTHAS